VNFPEFLGAGIWLIGFVLQAGNDLKLARLRADPSIQGRLLTSGFWRHIRQPSYFGDAARWKGYGLMGLAARS
jgi:steroid 5-alpha reductase family enzyme